MAAPARLQLALAPTPLLKLDRLSTTSSSAGGLYGLFPYRERLSGLIDRETEQ
jgi:hypothetical protein